MRSKVIRNPKSIFIFYKQLSVRQKTILPLFCLLLIFLSACKPKEKYYSPEEARRIADSAAWEILRPLLKDAEENFELRKRVELPHQLGIKNPYVEHDFEPIIPQMDAAVRDSNAPLPDDFQPLDESGMR